MDFEKLGAFYLGKEFDVKKRQLLDRLLMYDSRDLTTHAMCVGMTGSGKTGLCIDLLEEAAIDHVPAIIIDPKGDITNLLLTFPDLQAKDFRPWINVDDARRKDLSEDAFASQQAELWRNGLAQWGQDGGRIRMLVESTDFVIYTPGSDAGVPVSILQSFAAPALSWETEDELLRERIQGTVNALLGLIGVAADPIRSREHILMANLFEHFWRQGEDLGLLKLITAIQRPPIRQLGAFDTDTFFPPKDRFELAMNLNNIIAAPSFQSWLQGQPLDISGFISTPNGKPRHSIFYIAHLSDPERMFFVTMLLNQLVTWVRSQTGTTSLRALFYMDEIFGFFPPVANPPTKQPMVTLLKTARAFGLGVVLTTQNPVDLDYKGLTNTGTWFIGRLQTERDKMRVLDGLEGLSSAAGQTLNRDAFSRIISSLENRVFLLHNVHQDTPVTFQTRWAMSYLRGPLTREQIRDLMKARQADQPIPTVAPKSDITPIQQISVVQTPAVGAPGPLTSPPIIASEIRQVYLPVHKSVQVTLQEIEKREGGSVEAQDQILLYLPSVLGMGRIHFVDRRLNLDEKQEFCLLAQIPSGTRILEWVQAQPLELTQHDLTDRPEPDARFYQLPDSMNEAGEFSTLKQGMTDHLYRNSSLKLLFNSALKAYSQPHENERDFQMRLNQSARERRDEEVELLNKRYEVRLRTLQERLRRAQAVLERKQADAEARKREVMVSVGESVLGAFLGRRSTRVASTALSKYRQSTAAKMGVEEAEQNAEALQQEISKLQQELQDQVVAITKRWDDALKAFEKVPVRPNRNDIEVDFFALAWVPHWQVAYRDRMGSTRTEIMASYLD
jgi:hypothetical protein